MSGTPAGVTAAPFAHQRFGCVGQHFEPRQAEKAARALDRMDQPENVREDGRVVRLALEFHEFEIDDIETLGRLGQKLRQEIVHFPPVKAPRHTPPTRDSPDRIDDWLRRGLV